VGSNSYSHNFEGRLSYFFLHATSLLKTAAGLNSARGAYVADINAGKGFTSIWTPCPRSSAD